MKQVNTFVFAVLMFAAICLCILSVANAAPATASNSDTTITSIDTNCVRCEMTKAEFIEYLENEGAIANPSESALVANYFYVTDNSWYTISIDSWNAYLRNLESVARALEAKKKYGDLIELDDILDLD
jgi:hypothetical protein